MLVPAASPVASRGGQLRNVGRQHIPRRFIHGHLRRLSVLRGTMAAMPTASEFAAAARTHLPTAMAESWLSLLRPAIRLAHADNADAPVGHLGGSPDLPAEAPWPRWEGHGPLTYIAGIDCPALPSEAAGLGLPDDGQLLFFYFDGQYDDRDAIVLPGDQRAQAGARVIHIPAGHTVAPRPAPDGIEAYPRIPLTARIVTTAPSYDHPILHDTFGEPFTHGTEHPLRTRDFWSVVWSGGDEQLHQLGGYAWPVQGDVEYEVAQLDASEPRRWVLLAQFDSEDDAGMMWGDSGMLYWLIQPNDLAMRRFDRAVFTWQCC
jgi:uncharacterized protein YwqG